MDLLLKNMQTMQEQMKAMQKGQEETCMWLARQSHKDSYVFKKKGNECQFKANEEVKEWLEVAAGYLDSVEAVSGKEQLDLAKKEIAEDVFASGCGLYWVIWRTPSCEGWPRRYQQQCWGAGQTVLQRSTSGHISGGKSGQTLDKESPASQFKRGIWCCICSTLVSPRGVKRQ